MLAVGVDADPVALQAIGAGAVALVDGDVLYAVTTGEVENLALPSLTLGVLASELAWDAVLAAVA